MNAAIKYLLEEYVPVRFLESHVFTHHDSYRESCENYYTKLSYQGANLIIKQQ